MTRALSVFIRNFLSCLLVAGALVTASAYAQVGTFQFVIGDVRVRNAAGVERPAVQGATVNERDTIVSGATGEAQLLMVDNAYVAIRRNTELRIDQYNYKGRNDGTESGVLHLVKGTFRALTGLIVRNNKQNFTMKTAVSTIGIRGTGNITNHDPGANVTVNHTVTGSHSVTSVDPTSGAPIGITVETRPGVTVQVQPGQPPRQIPTPSFILAEASRDPKEKKAEPAKKEEAKPAPRSESLARAETETRESQPEAPKQEPPAPPPPPAATEAVVVSQTPAPSATSTSEQQLLQANLLAQIKGTFLKTVSAFGCGVDGAPACVTASLSATVTQTQASASNAGTSATNAGAVTPVDLTATTTTVNLASTVGSFFLSDQKLQSFVSTAQNELKTANAAAGAGNTSSNLVNAQTAAGTAAKLAQAQVSPVQTAAGAAQILFNTAYQLYLDALAAFDANDFTKAQSLLQDLKTQSDLTLAKQGEAAAGAGTAAGAAQSAATELGNANTAKSTATQDATDATTAANSAISLAQSNLAAPLQGTLMLAQTSYNNISTATTGLVAQTQSAATSAGGSSASASTLSAVDLTTLDSKIALAIALKPFAPANQQATIQSQIDSAQAARTTAFNAAGLGNTSSTLATAQSSASGASTTASGQVTVAQNAAAAALSAYNLAQQIYNNAVTALNNNDIALATQLLSDLVVQKDLVLAKEADAATALKVAQDAATTAAAALKTAQSAVSTAGQTVASTTLTIDQTIASLLTNVQAVADATDLIRDQIAGINTALSTASGTTAQQAFNAASTAFGNATTPGTAQGDATTIASITAINTTLASQNLGNSTTPGTVAGIATKAQNQVSSATSIYDANGAVVGIGGTGFRDAQASGAKTSMDSANSLINAPTTGYLTVATAKNTDAGNQSTALTNAKASALTQAQNATTAFNTAPTSATTTFNALTTAMQVEATTTNADQSVANLLSLANTAATAAQNYANSAATNPSDATLAAAELAKVQAYLALAQQIQTVIQQRDAVVAAKNQLATLLGQADAAKIAGDAAVLATTTALNNATTAAPNVANNAVITQYRNPLVVTSNRMTSVGVGANRLGASNNERFQSYAVDNANTDFVIGPTVAGFTNNLDTTRSLVESKATDNFQLDKGGTLSTPPGALSGSMTVAGETAFDYFVAVNTTPGSENYIELGRVTGGQIKSGATVVVDLGTGTGARSYHWMIGYEPPAGYTSPTKLTGTTTYTMISGGRTLPTDANGAVGTLNSATLSVDFTNQLVNAGVDATVAGKQYVATTGTAPVMLGVGPGGPGSPQFGGPFQTVNCSGTGCSGTYGGDLTGSLTGEKADGGGFVYSLFPATAAGTAYTDLIQGAVAFQASTPPAPAPQPDANIATAYHTSGGSSATTFQAIGTGYTLDLGGNLIQVSENPALTDNVESQAISGGTSPVQGTGVAIAGGTINYGRWQDGSVSGFNFNGAFGPDTVQGAYHWMKGPVIGPFYLTQALTGTVTYGSPFGMVTDQAGVAGTLNTEATSTFNVNFTQQFVNFDIRATTGAGNWRGQGSSVGLEDSGQFFAFTGSTQPHRNMTVSLGGVTTGSFGQVDGTFMGNGVEGVGMAFAFGQGTNKAAGTIGFTAAGQNPAAPYRVGLLAVGMTEAGAIAGNAEFNHHIGGGMNADARVLFESGIGSDPTRLRRVDGLFPLPQPTGCTTGCTGVSETPAVFSTKQFGAPPPTGTLASGVTNSGTDPTTGITWGRYNSGMQVNDRVDGTVINPDIDLTANNWHYIVGPMQTSPTVLPTTGVATYAVVGNTNPTNNVGQVGTLGSATLSADFSAKTVNVGVNISGTVGTWAASASGVPIQQGTFFDARSGASNLSVTSSVAGTTSGRIVGGFTGTTGQGAMMGYSLNAGGNVSTNAAARTVSGVVGFQKP